MMKSRKTLAVYIFLISISCSKTEVVRVTYHFQILCRYFFFLGEVPRFQDNTLHETYICQKLGNVYRFATSYNEHNHIPNYSAYTINSFQKQGTRKDKWHIETQLSPVDTRNNKFNQHPDAEMTVPVKNEVGYHQRFQAVSKDYAGSGYHRGHLNPVSHHQENKEEMLATFTLTNAAPQAGTFNQGVWSVVERKVKDKMKQFCNFTGARRYIITGVIPSKTFIKSKTTNTNDGPPAKTANFQTGVPGVNVPNYFWSAVCCDSSHANNETDRRHGWSLGFLSQNMAKTHAEIYTVQDLKTQIGAISLFHDFKESNGEIVKNCLFNDVQAKTVVQSMTNQNTHKTIMIKSNELN